MPIHTEPIAELALDSMEAVTQWASTQDSLRRIPVSGVLERGATIRDDQYLGDGDVLLGFNAQGFQSFCQRIGVRTDLLTRLETPSLASQLLNDLLAQRDVRERFGDDELVVDESTGTIIGLVSSTYVTYPNSTFLADASELIQQLGKDGELRFHQGYGINTELTLRLTCVTRHGTITGRGGQGEDVSKLGLELRNTMVGNGSIRINYFLHRLVCANGLMVPAAESVNRVFHSGREASLHTRLNRAFTEVMRNLGQLQALLDTLGQLDFDAAALAKLDGMTDRIFDVIPGSKRTISECERLFLRYENDASAADRERMRREHDARMIGLIPKHFGGKLSRPVFSSPMRNNASLFDFINVFTEHAKSETPARKLEIEERTGALAQYIASNARKL